MAATAASSYIVLAQSLPSAAKQGVVLCSSPQTPFRCSTPPRPLKVLKRSSSSQLLVKAYSSDDSSVDPNEFLTDLKEKWDAVENKSTVILYGGGAIVTVWLASTVVGAINNVPLLPKIMELVGLGYTGWFVYRYLLFKSSRKELASDIESLKKKITGTE